VRPEIATSVPNRRREFDHTAVTQLAATRCAVCQTAVGIEELEDATHSASLVPNQRCDH